MSTPRPRSISLAKLALPLITLVLAIVAVVIGYLLTSTGLSDLNTALASQTATATDVYGGQSEIGVASAVLSAGIISVVVSLAAIGLIIALSPRVAVAPVEEFDFSEDELDADDEIVEPTPAVAVSPDAAPTSETEPKSEDELEATPAR